MPKKKTKPKKRDKLMILPWITMVIASVTLVFVVVSLGYLWYYAAVLGPMFQLGQNQLTLQDRINMLETQAISERQWNIYQDVENKFMIQYPTDWTIQKDADENSKITLISDPQIKDDPRNIIVSVYDSAADLEGNVNELSFEEWLDPQFFVNKQDITRDGVKGVVGLAAGEGAYYTMFFELEDGTIYKIRHTYPSGEINTVEKRIFDSFEFLTGTKGL